MDSVATTPRRGSFRILLALIAALMFGAGPASTLAEEGGAYTLQCMCPLEWEESWDGQGVFDESDRLDTVALANDGAVLLIHEIPLDDGTVAGMVDDRSASLGDARAIEDLDEILIDAGQEDWIQMGRSWTGAEGERMLSVQYVQVWEVNFLLSVEFVAPEDDFVEGWASLDEVLLIGSPILADLDGEDIFDEIA